MIWNIIVSVALTAISAVYSRKRQKEAEKEMDKQKGLEVEVTNEAGFLPIVYGRQKVGGIRTFHKTRSDWDSGDQMSSFGYTRTPASGYVKDANNYAEFNRVGSSNRFALARLVWNGTEVYRASASSWFDSGLSLSEYVQGFAQSVNNLTTITIGTAKNYIDVVQIDGYFYSFTYAPGTDLTTTYSQTITSYTTHGGDNDYDIGTTSIVVGSVKVGIARKIINGTQYFNKSRVRRDFDGSKNTFLIVQQALALGGINKVVDIDVDDQSWDEEELQYGQEIRVYTQGGVACPMATANGARATNYFTNTAYASMMFRLNRDDYNYNGVPDVFFYVEGRPVKDILYNSTSGTYSLTTGTAFTTNPARILLDYLMADFGRGLPVNQVDLESFYKAMLLCDTTVVTGAKVTGKIYGKRPPEEDSGTTQGTVDRNLPRFACNITLDSGAKVRDNIEQILETMPGAELVWSGGKYKLQFVYPTSAAQQAALVVMDLTDDDVVRNSVDLTWGDNTNTYNQVTVTFNNEEENFETDSVTWPPQFTNAGAVNTVYTTYLNEDGGIPLKGSFNIAGIVNKRHALARAEQICRESRRAHSVNLTVTAKGMVLEPGDLVTVTLDQAFISNQTYKVLEVSINEDMTVNLSLGRYAWDDQAWNVGDWTPYITRYVSRFRIPAPTNITFTPSESKVRGYTSGTLRWSHNYDKTCTYEVGIASVDDETYTILGRTSAKILPIDNLRNGVYQFVVFAVTPLGHRSVAGESLVMSYTGVGVTQDVSLIYANTADPATNTQSYTFTNQAYAATKIHPLNNRPTLPIRSGIEFYRIRGEDGTPGTDGVITPENWDDIELMVQQQGIIYADTYAELPAGPFENGKLAFVRGATTLYRFDTTTNTWVEGVYGGLPDGYIDTAKFAQGIEPVSIYEGNALPTAKITSTIFWNGGLYRWESGAYTNAIPAVNITGQLTSAQIASIEAAKVAGQLTSGQIADIDAAKVVGQLVSSQIAALDSTKISGQLTDAQIADINAAKVAGQLVEAQIAANAITPAKLAVIPGHNLIADPKFTSQSSWTLNAGWTWGTNKVTYNPANGSGWTNVNCTQHSTIAAGMTYKMRMRYSYVTATTALIRFRASAYDPSFTQLGDVGLNGVTLDGSGEFTVTITMPAGATTLKPRIEFNQANTDGIVDITGIELFHITSADTVAANAIESNAIIANAIITSKVAANAIDNARIAANAVNANSIAANGVTTAALIANAVSNVKIAANAVEAAAVAVNAIAGTKILDNAISTGKIAANAVTAATIAANAIVAGKVAANAIDANAIAANAVTASSIAANAITTQAIAANAVTAVSLAAGSITASQLALVDSTNPLAGSEDPDRSGWYLNTAGIANIETYAGWNTSVGYGAKTTCMRFVGGGTANLRYFKWPGQFPVEPGAEYYFELYFNKSTEWDGGNLSKFRVVDNSNTVELGRIHYTAAAGTAGVWVKGSTSITIPAGVTSVILEMGCDATAGWCFVSDMMMRRKNGSSLIVDGAITSNSLATGAVTANAVAANAIVAVGISANAIVAGKIATNAVDANAIAANSIVSGKILAGTVDVNALAANSVNASKIVALSVTAAEIAANTITAAKVAANTLTANEIAANAITVSELAAGSVDASKIVALSITAAEIAANTITAAKVAANTLTAAEIAANAITASELSAGSVSANHIVANTITAAQIAANTITAAQILANTITTNELAANAVNANNIAANAITVGKVAAGAIGTDQIAANAVVASKIMITDFTNQIPDSEMQDKASWSFLSSPTNVIVHYPTTPRSDGKSIGSFFYDHSVNTGLSNAWLENKTFFPVTPGDELLFSAQMIRAGGTKLAIALQARFYDKNDVLLTTNGTINAVNITATTVNTATPFSGTVTVPAGAFQARLRFLITNSAGNNDGDVHMLSPSVRVRNAGSLIVDGAINTNHLAANSITATQIATDAVTAAKISVSNLAAVSATIGTLRTASTGARLEVISDKIRVYDSSGTLRVLIGNLA